jgi:small subunit ribosomal protein S33
MATILPSRLTALTHLRCSIFQTSYNPTSVRTGAKYLRRRLRGPSMGRYYPQEINLSQIARQYPELELVNEIEEQRLQDVEDRRKRGKGAPKKAKTKGQWQKLHRHLYLTIAAGESRRTGKRR